MVSQYLINVEQTLPEGFNHKQLYFWLSLSPVSLLLKIKYKGVCWVFWSHLANVNGFIQGLKCSVPHAAHNNTRHLRVSLLPPPGLGPLLVQGLRLGRRRGQHLLSPLSPLCSYSTRVACKEKVEERGSMKFLFDGSRMTLDKHSMLLAEFESRASQPSWTRLNTEHERPKHSHILWSE